MCFQPQSWLIVLISGLGCSRTHGDADAADCCRSGLNLTGWFLCSQRRFESTVLSHWLHEIPSPIPAELKGRVKGLVLFPGVDCTHWPWHLKRWELGQGGSVWESCLNDRVQVEMNCLPSRPSPQTAEALVWKEAWLCPQWLEKLLHAMQIPSAGACHNLWGICFKDLRWDRSQQHPVGTKREAL